MTICFTHLKIIGFKSFADSTSLDILPGLTGIVGPNGCGKSNIVEAIRWAMGESSARSLRGGEMDDVIFAGTTRRAAHNHAEVILTLENSEISTKDTQSSLTPALFQNQPQLQISRLIERNSGSHYRLNGKTQRARDIQTLFADLGSGPRSSAIISQNRIAQLISASPEERRQVLEEAAGISGLHNRRREAELKLKATEENLCRLDDLKQQLEKYLNELQEQSIQATRYRSLSASVRENEIHLQALYYLRAQNQLQNCRLKVSIAQDRAKEKTLHHEEIRKKLTSITEQLTKIRHQETQARIQWEQPRQQIQVIQNKQKEINQTLDQFQERLQEAQNQYEITQNHITKVQTDQNDLKNQIKVIDESLENYPTQKSEAEDKIRHFAEKATLLGNKIKQADQELSKRKKDNQTLLDLFEQAKQKKQEIQKDYEENVQAYQICLQQVPDPQHLKEQEHQQHRAQERLDSLQRIRQDLQTEKQTAQLEANKLAYHTQQITEKYRLLQHNIHQAEQHQKQLEQEKQNVQSQIEMLLHQTLQKKDKEAKHHQLSASEQELNFLKSDIKTAVYDHQQAIKERLEQEGIYQQKLQAYKNRIQIFETSEIEWQQAQKNFDHLSQQSKVLSSQFIDPIKLQELENNYAQKQQALQHNQQQLTMLEQKIQEATKHAEHQQTLLNRHRTHLQHLQTKRDSLKQILLEMDHSTHAIQLPSVLDTLSLPAEWIPTLAAIFDDTIEAPVSQNAIHGWIEMSPLQSKFPTTLTTLADIITPPPALQRAFSQIGIVKTKAEGHQLFPHLQIGQILATQEGDVWRWDGYYQTHAKQSKAAQKLLQQRHLRKIETELKRLLPQTSLREDAYYQAQKVHQTLKEHYSETQNHYKILEKSTHQSGQDFFALQNQAQTLQTQWEALQPALQQAQDNLKNKETIRHKAKEMASSPAPNQQNIQQSIQEEHKKEKILKEKQHHYENLEKQYTNLKEAYQQALHQDEQNKIRIENFQVNYKQIEQDIAKNTKQTILYKEQLKHAQNPQQVAEKTKQAESKIEHLQQKLQTLDKDFEHAQLAFQQSQQNFQRLKDLTLQQKSRLETLEPRCHSLKSELDHALLALQEAEEALQNRSDEQELEILCQTLQQEYENVKKQEDEARLTYHLILNTRENALKQKESLTIQMKNWQTHLTENLTELQETQKRITSLRHHIQKISPQPQLLQDQLLEMQKSEQETSLRYSELQKQVIELDNKRKEVEERLQLIEQQNHKAHEYLLKAQAKQEQAEALLSQVEHNLTPEIKTFASEHPDLELNEHHEKELKTSIISLTEQREALGAVNLRAELEFKEKKEQLDQLESQYIELTTAIQQLRESINTLNQQGKTKLHAIFNEVNQHFQDLFSRMFNGGQAYLKLLAHEDPLQSGLEIYAQPPGKKLSTLSLLSGGEQALTALSLVFAVSQCNPVPICILDEVDAPLDDQNVERFCTLLSDMTAQAGTRFLVVTHHQLTMSHMQRLYGVTMQERGISQLISIDLESAVQIQESKQPEQLEFS